ncbi:hypothetical protein O3G_MSEX007821 [Manduca sexta]|uniref:Nitrate/nitrite sensing protein domain-containing protein n=1 Tax=Manduca sexta TaxID=7130 RepID=A0A921Z9X1_MANSE|nr:hypothetical protein O3G_MSEX007821 [Manduca sexta]
MFPDAGVHSVNERTTIVLGVYDGASINAGTSMTEAVEWYTNANAALLNHLTKEIKDTDSSTIWRYLVGFKNLLRSIECKGIASVLGINYFARGYLQARAHERYITHMVLGRDLLDNTLNLVPSLIPLHKDIKEDSPEYQDLEKNPVLYCPTAGHGLPLLVKGIIGLIPLSRPSDFKHPQNSNREILRRDRESSGLNNTKDGGGVLIAISKKFIANRLTEWESQCEDLWVTVEFDLIVPEISHYCSAPIGHSVTDI